MSFVVGIAGGTASGKTTIAARFAQGTGATLIGHDRYYFDVENPRTHNYDEPAALDSALLTRHLAELRAGRPAGLPVYAFRTHRRQPETEHVLPADIVIVEGILVLAEPALVAQMDLTVFVACGDDVRLERRLLRDTAERGREWRDVLRQWRETVRPAHRRWVAPCQASATIVLDGEADTDHEVGRLMAEIQQRR